MLRTDRTVVPTMMKGGTVSLRELEQLRRIENVVRLGHVERIEPDRIVLEQGSIPTTPDHLHVHCAASGLSDNPPRAIFTDDTITLQLVTRVSLTLSGALQGFLESTGRTTEEKNRLCPPTVMPHTPFDYLRMVMAGISTEMGWQEAARSAGVGRSLAAQPLERLGRERRPRHGPRAARPFLRRRCFPRSTSCRCSRHRRRHGNERGCSNPRRVPTTEVLPARPKRRSRSRNGTLALQIATNWRRLDHLTRSRITVGANRGMR